MQLKVPIVAGFEHPARFQDAVAIEVTGGPY